MNLFGFNITRGRPQSGPQPTARSSPLSAAWLRGDDTDTSSSILCNAYEQVVWVYRAINVLAEAVANIPFLFSRGERGRENLITSGPLLDFYAHPHPYVNQFQYWELRIMWLMLRGECFRVPIYEDASAHSGYGVPALAGPGSSDSTPQNTKCSSLDGQLTGGGLGKSIQRFNDSTIRSKRRRLKSVVFLDPANVHHVIENHELIGWRYTGAGQQAPLESQVFLPEEIWFERLPNPFSYWRGMSPLMVADLPARTDFAASAFMRGIMENNADAGLIVRSDQLLGEEQREQVLATLRNRKRKAGSADRPIFLWGVNEIIKPELSSADMEYLANRKYSRSEICAAFGVPEEIVTTTDKAKYDVMAGARLNFLQNRVVPLCARLEAEEDVTVKAIDPNAIGWFDVDSVPLMQEALKTRLIAAKTGFDMGIPFNFLNREFDLGFPEFPWGNTGYLPSKLRPVGSFEESSSFSSSSSSSNSEVGGTSGGQPQGSSPKSKPS